MWWRDSAQVDRHLRKLDQELAKFKMELEADHAGITEILERRELMKPILSQGNVSANHVLWSSFGKMAQPVTFSGLPLGK